MKRCTIFLLGLGLPLFGAETSIFKWSGDLRYRHEYIRSQETSTSDYHQHRLMFRTGAVVGLLENLETEFRLATSTGRTSTNQTLTGNFGNFAIGLDRAFFTWKLVDHFSLYGGRMKNTYYVPKGSDLVWDSDLNFDGLSFSYLASESNLRPFFNGTFYWLMKDTAASSSDNHLVSVQMGAQTKFSETKLAAGLAFHHYTNMTASTAIDTSNFKGNSSAGAGATATYAHHYSLINPNAEILFNAADLPIAVYADLVMNTAVTDDKLGFLVGTSLGDVKKKGDWKLSYDFRQLKADCAVGAFTDGDSFLGGTNGRSHRLRAAYRLLEPLQVAMSLYLGSKNISNGQTALDRHKIHMDLTLAF